MKSGKDNPMTSYLRFDTTKRVEWDLESSVDNSADVYRVIGSMSFYVGERNREYWVHVPHGHRVTGADIPELFRDWIKPTSKEGKAAIIHHYLCSTGKVKIHKTRMCINRTEANWIFLQAMRVAGVGFLKRWIIFLVASLTDGELRPEESKNLFSTS